jgi:lipoprotein-anchoring transpeptidase ErfK/SrfK
MRRACLAAALLAAFSLAMPDTGLGAQVPRSHGRITKQLLPAATAEKPGTILISTEGRTLDLVLAGGKVARYSIAVGRDGFTWSGTVKVGRKAEWPEWRPPADMRQRAPELPEMVPAGPFNPLGIRAIYLFQGDRDTLYRIHGTNDGLSIGDSVSSGCSRMTNADILELYDQVRIGAKVVVK